MSQVEFKLAAQSRSDEGKGASRRLRHSARLPAIIYGGDDPAQSISLELKELVKRLDSEAFYSHVIDLDVDGVNQKVVLKDIQRHPVKNTPMHVDFLRVKEDREILVRVPLHFKNLDNIVGVKTQGGRLSILMNEVMVRTLPQNLPEFIEVDLSGLQAGTAMLLANVVLPEGVTIPALAKPQNSNVPVAKVKKPRGGASA